MPNCFCLTRKGSSEPEKLQHIDDRMSWHFGVEPSRDEWFLGWYDVIGLGLACGKTFADLRSMCERNIVKLVEERSAAQTSEIALAQQEYIDYWSKMRQVVD